MHYIMATVLIPSAILMPKQTKRKGKKKGTQNFVLIIIITYGNLVLRYRALHKLNPNLTPSWCCKQARNARGNNTHNLVYNNKSQQSAFLLIKTRWNMVIQLIQSRELTIMTNITLWLNSTQSNISHGYLILQTTKNTWDGLA